jgi:predicted RNA binding protein YcfA (HicA-like mRNA interferase family)
MTKPAKLYASLLANPNQIIAFRDFERLLRAFGFELDRTEGSHRLYVHPNVPRPLPVQPAKGGKDAKPYQVRQFLVMVRSYELGMAE